MSAVPFSFALALLLAASLAPLAIADDEASESADEVCAEADVYHGPRTPGPVVEAEDDVVVGAATTNTAIILTVAPSACSPEGVESSSLGPWAHALDDSVHLLP